MYGSLGVGVTNSLSGIFINECFRRQCLLPKSALFLIGMPIVTVSTIAVTFLHYKVHIQHAVIISFSRG